VVRELRSTMGLLVRIKEKGEVGGTLLAFG
jgi:hypothetical protein